MLAFRLLLTAIFGIAAVAKFLDRAGARQAVRSFGIPESLVAVAATVVPVAELLVAAALFDTATTTAGAVAAVVLLAIFIVGIAVTLARGAQPDCGCFGRLHSAAVGRKTLARDAVFLAMAGLVAVAGPGAGLAAWAKGVSALDWITILVAGVLAVALVVEGSQLLERRQRRDYPQDLSTAGDKAGENHRRLLTQPANGKQRSSRRPKA
ncbi:MAG: MauE/DoxX family redox-associated membrane protein [Acidimicrobiales bacterium]